MAPRFPYNVLAVPLDRTFRNALNENFTNIALDLQELGASAFDALEAAGEANTQALYAQEQGDYANEKAVYADEQGDYALAQGNIAAEKAQDAETATTNAGTAIDELNQVKEDNQINWLQEVSTVAARDTAYPTPSNGDTVRITEEARVDRYNGTNWVTTDRYNPAAIDQVTQQLAETENDILALLKRTSRSIYEYKHLVIDIGIATEDWLPAIQQALNDVSALGGGSVVVPYGNHKYKGRIDIPNNVFLIGFGFNQSVLDLTEVVDGIMLHGNYSGIHGITLKTPANYIDKSGIIITTGINGHTWNQRVTKTLIVGVDQTGNAIKIEPRNGYGIMNTFIDDFLIRGFNNAILFNAEIGVTGWANGGTISNGWQDLCKYGLAWTANSTANSRWVVDKYRGQNNTGISVAHISEVKGQFKFRDTMMWDGAQQITVSPLSTNTIIEDCGINQNQTMSDKGYLTVIRQGYETRETNKFVIEEENFMGAGLSSKWNKNLLGGGTANLGMDTSYSPFTSGLILETGAVLDDHAGVNYGTSFPYNRYLDKVMSFKFRLSSIANVEMYSGFKIGSSGYFGNFLRALDGKLEFVNRNSTTDLNVLDASLYLDTKQHIAQINIVGGEAHLHIDGKYIGAIPRPEFEVQPYFIIKTKEAATKRMTISNLRIRSMQYYWA